MICSSLNRFRFIVRSFFKGQTLVQSGSNGGGNVTEADQEGLTDIIGSDTALLYHFIGEGDRFDRPQLEAILKGAETLEDRIDFVIEFLLYYGFLGSRLAAKMLAISLMLVTT